MRVMLLHKLAEHIPEDYVPPQKLIADVGKMVSDALKTSDHVSQAIRFARGWLLWQIPLVPKLQFGAPKHVGR
jgi:hypothetical protein